MACLGMCGVDGIFCGVTGCPVHSPRPRASGPRECKCGAALDYAAEDVVACFSCRASKPTKAPVFDSLLWMQPVMQEFYAHRSSTARIFRRTWTISEIRSFGDTRRMGFAKEVILRQVEDRRVTICVRLDSQDRVLDIS